MAKETGKERGNVYEKRKKSDVQKVKNNFKHSFVPDNGMYAYIWCRSERG